jgi:hypothetical protein
MRGTFKHASAAAFLLIGLAMAGAPPVYAQGYTLNSASLGTNAITMTIPKTGNTQSVHTLRLHYSGGNGANCTTGSLNDYWGPSGSRAPAGVTPGYSSSPMSLPSSLTRTIAINVYSTAVPMSRQWTIVVPSGSCRGGNQTSTVTVTLVKAK